MDAAAVDPRDIKWEVASPIYRVYFWSQADLPPGVPGERGGWRSEEWRLAGSLDVHEVLAWAEQRKDGRTYTLHVEINTEQGAGMVDLAGVDPTRTR